MEYNAQVLENSSSQSSARLYYLDWLRVLATFMVFLYHAVHPFDFFGWQIKNAEQSESITIALVLLGLWGMPFFFLVAGSASWFALRRRTGRQYISERVRRLLIPYIVGTILFAALQYYLWYLNQVQLGDFSGPFGDWIRIVLPPFDPLRLSTPGFSPKWLSAGFHLWFIAFLFLYALITLPLFLWLKSERGKPFVDKLARICEYRGGVLVLVVPLLVVQFILRPFFIEEHDWADFIFRMCFFIVGYILYAHESITRALRRDGWLLLGIGTGIVVILFIIYFAGMPLMDWAQDPALPQYYLVLCLTTPLAFCYSVAMLFIGMRFLNFTNDLLRYSQEAVLPFFVLHQPIIIVIAFYVVQWNASLWIKLPVVVLSSFIVTISSYELIIRRIPLLRLLFGIKAQVPVRQMSSTD